LLIDWFIHSLVHWFFIIPVGGSTGRSLAHTLGKLKTQRVLTRRSKQRERFTKWRNGSLQQWSIDGETSATPTCDVHNGKWLEQRKGSSETCPGTIKTASELFSE